MVRNALFRLLASLTDLVDANFAGHDDLHAASLTIEDPEKSASLRQLSEELRRHAIELQGLLSDMGISSSSPAKTELQSRAFFDFAKQQNGTEEILRIAANCYRIVKDEYDSVLDTHPENATTDFLRRQYGVIDVGEATLRAMGETRTLDMDVGGCGPRFSLSDSTETNRFRV